MKNILKISLDTKEDIKAKVIARIILGGIFSIIWILFLKKKVTYRKFSYIVGEPIFFTGAILLTLAWFNYLKLDGISLGWKKREDQAKNSKGPILDLEEKSAILAEADDSLASFWANATTGLAFLLGALLIMLI